MHLRREELEAPNVACLCMETYDELMVAIRGLIFAIDHDCQITESKDFARAALAKAKEETT